MTFISQRQRVFNLNEFRITKRRSESRLKRYPSIEDYRAWSSFCDEERAYILDLICREPPPCPPLTTDYDNSGGGKKMTSDGTQCARARAKVCKCVIKKPCEASTGKKSTGTKVTMEANCRRKKCEGTSGKNVQITADINRTKCKKDENAEIIKCTGRCETGAGLKKGDPIPPNRKVKICRNSGPNVDATSGGNKKTDGDGGNKKTDGDGGADNNNKDAKSLCRPETCQGGCQTSPTKKQGIVNKICTGKSCVVKPNETKAQYCKIITEDKPKKQNKIDAEVQYGEPMQKIKIDAEVQYKEPMKQNKIDAGAQYMEPYITIVHDDEPRSARESRSSPKCRKRNSKRFSRQGISTQTSDYKAIILKELEQEVAKLKEKCKICNDETTKLQVKLASEEKQDGAGVSKSKCNKRHCVDFSSTKSSDHSGVNINPKCKAHSDPKKKKCRKCNPKD